MGYLLPWGQMSYWGAQVIVNLFAAIPFIGPDLSVWIRGDYVVSDATLNRFFSFHVIAVPLVLLGLVAAHIVALHEVGSNNPDGVDIKARKDASGKPLDGIPFHPYYTVHDILGVSVFLILFSAVVFFSPELGGYFLEFNNFIPADPLKTPPHIAPVWYFTPFYSILRATTDEFLLYWLTPFLILYSLLVMASARRAVFKLIAPAVSAVLIAGFFAADAKFWGVVAMGVSVLIFFAMPWLDNSPVRSIRYRPGWHKWVYATFVVVFVVLGYFGVLAPSAIGQLVSMIGTLLYFGFFLLMPWWSAMGEFKTVPDRVTFEAH
jgi:ubiquinol-cytochrome c reductase cytochrome b subunit